LFLPHSRTPSPAPFPSWRQGNPQSPTAGPQQVAPKCATLRNCQV
jgi:hypothetical protein